MPKRRLALVLFASMALIVIVDLAVALALAAAHKPFIALLAAIPGTVPGFVIGMLAWRGLLPAACRSAPAS